MSEISCFRLVTVKPEVETKLIMMKEIKEEEDEEEDLVVTTSAEDAEDHEAEAVPGTNKKVKVLKTTQSLPAAATGTDPDHAGQKISRQNSLPQPAAHPVLDLPCEFKPRRPNPLIRMNSDPKMLPSIELFLSKEDSEELSFSELRKHLENCGPNKNQPFLSKTSKTFLLASLLRPIVKIYFYLKIGLIKSDFLAS